MVPSKLTTNALSSNQSTRLNVLLPWILLIALAGATILSAHKSKQNGELEIKARFESILKTQQQQTLRRLDSNSRLLNSIGSFIAHGSGNYQQSRGDYLHSLSDHIQATPGLEALGYIDYSLGHETVAQQLLPFTHAENSAFSLEFEEISRILRTDQEFLGTLELAKNARTLALSRPIQIPLAKKFKLIILIKPIYRSAGNQSNTVSAFLVAYINYDLLISILEKEASAPIKVAINDAAVEQSTTTAGGALHSLSVPIKFGERNWALAITSTPELETSFANSVPVLILVVGLIGTLLLAGLVWLLTQVREQAENMAARMTLQLRDQNKFTEDLIELNPNPIFRKDINGRFILVNRAWEKMTAMKREQVIGKSEREFRDESEANLIEASDRMLYANPEGTITKPAKIKSMDGRQFDAIISTAVLHKTDGNIEGLLGTITDVSQIKNLEREIERQREQLDLVIRSSQQGVWDIELSETGSYYFSDRFKELLGYRPDDKFPERFNPRSVVHPDDLDAFTDVLTQHLKGKTPLFNFETRVRRVDKKYLWVITRGIAQRDASGRAIRFTGSISDIADRKNAEFNLIEANKKVVETAQAKEAFLATMSHEIRTPLNGVLGMTSLLADTSLTDEQRDYIRVIRASGDTLLRLIDDVLDFSKIESGRMTLESVPVEVVAVAEEALELVSEKAREKQIQLLYDIDDEVPNYILGDATRLRQILLNLLSNAIKFTHQGHIHLHLGIRNVMSPKFELEGSVSDSGVGIPSDRVDKLFQPFTQVDASTTRKYGGTGLGLAICKRLTGLMGGDISVTSVEGEGSVFTFHILTETARGRLKPHMQRNVADFEDKRVLYVDDFVPRRQILAKVMQRWGLTVLPSDFEQAVSTLAAEPVDVILTNMLTEDEYSLAFAKALHATNETRALPVPVIILSRLQRTEIVHARLKVPIPHQFMLARTLLRAKLFDTLSRAIANMAYADASTRPYSFETIQDADHANQTRESETITPGTAVTLKPPKTVSSNMANSLKPLRLLVAEDNEVNQRVIMGMLKNLGHQATIAPNGLEAVKAAMADSYDAILMDIHMPELDGISAMDQIREKLAGKRCPPIIAMTANALAGDRENYLQQGMDEYISKPIKVEELNNTLERALSVGTTSHKAASASSTRLKAVKMPAQEIKETAVLDTEQLEELRYLPATSGGENAADDPVGGLLTLFQDKAKERMQLMKSHLDTMNWAPLAEVAHSLRGSSASMGFARVAVLSKQIELAARERVIKPNVLEPDIGAIFTLLQQHYTEAEITLADWIKSTP